MHHSADKNAFCKPIGGLLDGVNLAGDGIGEASAFFDVVKTG